MEPSVGDDGVPTFARLLTRPGESVYRCFVDTRKDRKGKPVYYCSDCGFKSDRLHRLIGHQRSKRGHRPFACPDEGWRVHPLLLPQTLRPSDPHHPAPRTPFRSVGQLLIARVVFVVVIFADTPRRVWVTIGVIEMACSPASSGTYSLLVPAPRGRDGRLTNVHIIFNCSGDTIVKKNMARHIIQVMDAHVH